MPPSTLYIAPRPLNIWERFKYRGQTGLTITKGEDGLRYLFLITSNGYMDREREYITTKALQHYVEKSWLANDVCQPDNALLFWHDGDPIGDVVWTDMQGPFLMEVAKERATPFAVQVWDYLEAHPELKWGASHGFRYADKRVNPNEDTATYDAIDKFETSVLPLRYAANPYTFAGVVNMDERDTLLDKILGKAGAAKKLREGVQAVKTELDQQGVEHKGLDAATVKGLIDGIGAKVDVFLGQLMDSPPDGLKEELMKLIVAKLGDGAGEVPPAEDMPLEAEMGTKPDEIMGKQIKLLDTLTDTQVNLVKAIEGIEAHQDEQDKAIKALTPLNTLAQEFKALKAELTAVKAQLAGRPRIASQAPETGQALSAEDKAKIDKQLTPRDAFWGN